MMKTRIEQNEDGTFRLVSIETGSVFMNSDNLASVQGYQANFERTNQEPATLKLHLPTMSNKALNELIGYPYSDTPSRPFFGDPNRKEPETDKVYELGKSDLIAPDVSKIATGGGNVTRSPIDSNQVALEDFLRQTSMREMINAIFWQMAKAEGFPGVFSPNEQQYNDIMNFIFDNYVDRQNGNKYPQSQSPNNRPIDPKIIQSRTGDLIRKLTMLEGLRPPKILFEDYPEKVSILIVIDPEFEFRDEDHMNRWETRLRTVLTANKPFGLSKLEAIFNRTEVF